MTGRRKHHSAAYLRARLKRRIAGGLAVIWMGFVLYLDYRYALFPKTTVGGLKILAGAAILYVPGRILWMLAARLWRLTRGKDKRRAFATSVHTPS